MDKFEEYRAFIDFDEIDSDFVLELDLNLAGRTFPKSRFTCGDLLRREIPAHKNTKPSLKIFKQLYLNQTTTQSEEKLPEIPQQSIINNIQEQKIVSEINNKTENIEQLTSNVEQITHEHHEDILNQTQEFKTIEQMILNQVETSNHYTQEQIIELEQNLHEYYNTNITNNSLTNLKQEIVHLYNETKNELKEQIVNSQKRFEEFLNS